MCHPVVAPIIMQAQVPGPHRARLLLIRTAVQNVRHRKGHLRTATRSKLNLEVLQTELSIIGSCPRKGSLDNFRYLLYVYDILQNVT